MLGTASLLIGFSSIGFAVRLVRRVGRHHAPRTEMARERLSQLRRMWALLVAGGGAGFAGVAFLLTSLHHWFVNPGAERLAGLVPLGLTSILIGLALLIATTAVYILAVTGCGLARRLFVCARSGVRLLVGIALDCVATPEIGRVCFLPIMGMTRPKGMRYRAAAMIMSPPATFGILATTARWRWEDRAQSDELQQEVRTAARPGGFFFGRQVLNQQEPEPC